MPYTHNSMPPIDQAHVETPSSLYTAELHFVDTVAKMKWIHYKLSIIWKTFLCLNTEFFKQWYMAYLNTDLLLETIIPVAFE